MIQFTVITLFPEMFGDPFNASMLKRAREKGLISIEARNLRDFCSDKHRVTDDLAYGGGGGMVMKPEPLVAAIEAMQAAYPGSRTVLMTPQGKPFTQRVAERFAGCTAITLVCGHYEGVDERVRYFVDEELSIGDYILTGGELAAMVVIDAVSRHIPGVIGDGTALAEESFTRPLLEAPHYTRPRHFRGFSVPEVLVSGNHADIEQWRREQALQRTRERRPDLLSEN
jgi:tRNA (guanine37-N1)-methyltransferase